MDGILSEVEIVQALYNNEIAIIPVISADEFGPTIELRLGTEFIIKKMDSVPHYDPVEFHNIYSQDPEKIWRYYEIVKRVDPTVPFWLHPNQFAIGCTLEYVHLPCDIGAHLEGKSSWAREGLNVHSTAGIIHIGHSGIIAFELHNVGTHPIALYPGTKVAQLELYRLSRSANKAYAELQSAKYAKHVATAIGRPWIDWEFTVLSDRIALSRSKQ
ncbi:MAG: dCTP deaminase [Dehalococcoidales bacterium]